MKKTIRLDKWLCDSGIGTRRTVKQIIHAGQVMVDGAVIKREGHQADPNVQTVLVNGETVAYRPFVYLMLNKPQGVISATKDAKDKTVIDLVPEAYKHYELFPVGRLDKDTEGLLLITNDGELAHNLLAPKKHVKKTYYAVVDGYVNEADEMLLLKGITIDDGYKTMPAQLEILDSDEMSAVLLTIEEGKYHQVKRMFEALDKRVLFLKRMAFGDLTLDPDLVLGEIRELTAEELSILQKATR